MMSVSLRPAAPADSEFCYQLHKAAMGGYVTAIWGWDEQVQRGFHDREVLPRYQGLGIGSRLVGGLAADARETGQHLVLDVLAVNHRAQALYQRLGLTEVGSRGDGDIKITMRRSRNGGGGR